MNENEELFSAFINKMEKARIQTIFDQKSQGTQLGTTCKSHKFKTYNWSIQALARLSGCW